VTVSADASHAHPLPTGEPGRSQPPGRTGIDVTVGIPEPEEKKAVPLKKCGINRIKIKIFFLVLFSIILTVIVIVTGYQGESQLAIIAGHGLAVALAMPLTTLFSKSCFRSTHDCIEWILLAAWALAGFIWFMFLYVALHSTNQALLNLSMSVFCASGVTVLYGCIFKWLEKAEVEEKAAHATHAAHAAHAPAVQAAPTVPAAPEQAPAAPAVQAAPTALAVHAAPAAQVAHAAPAVYAAAPAAPQAAQAVQAAHAAQPAQVQPIEAVPPRQAVPPATTTPPEVTTATHPRSSSFSSSSSSLSASSSASSSSAGSTSGAAAAGYAEQVTTKQPFTPPSFLPPLPEDGSILKEKIADNCAPGDGESIHFRD